MLDAIPHRRGLHRMVAASDRSRSPEPFWVPQQVLMGHYALPTPLILPSDTNAVLENLYGVYLFGLCKYGAMFELDDTRAQQMDAAFQQAVTRADLHKQQSDYSGAPYREEKWRCSSDEPHVLPREPAGSARYTPLGSNAECCGRCRFYMAPSSCGRIVGPVSPRGWCKYYSREMVQTWGEQHHCLRHSDPPPVPRST